MTTPNQQPIPAWIETSTDREGLKRLANRCSGEAAFADVRTAALRRYYGLAGREYSDPLIRDFYQALAAYEDHLVTHNASRVRGMLRNGKSELAILNSWALYPLEKTTQGFTALIEAGLPEFTGEAIVLRHASRFEAHVVQAARRRLERYGVDPAKIA
jgi:hypothetical protein